MRGLLAFACAALLPTMAGAQDLSAQYDAAVNIFGGGWADRQDFPGKEPQRLLAGIDGKWTELSRLGANGPGLIAKACERVFVETRRVSDFTFVVTLVAVGKDGTVKVDTTYNTLGGNSFSYSADISAFFARLFPNGTEDKVELAARVNMARQQNGIATVYRPSSDILVIAPALNGMAPDIYGRCPD
ncbi:MAG: hypothetical protein AB7S80_08300 [Rhizobiaceae bacterium]